MKPLFRLLFIVLIVWQGWVAVRMTIYDGYFRAGVRAYNDAEVEETARLFDRTRELGGADPEMWAWLGDATLYYHDWHAEGDLDPVRSHELLDKAWTAYANAVSRCPSYSWSWAGLAGVADRRSQLQTTTKGVDLAELGRLAEDVWDPMRAVSLASGSIAVELKPAGFQELDLLADIYLRAGKHERSRELFFQSARMMPAPSFHTWGAGRKFYGPVYRDVIAALAEGIEAAPSFERNTLYIEAGRFAYAQNDYNQALEFFEHALQFSINQWMEYRAHRELANTLRELGRFDESVAYYQKVLESPYAHPSTYRQLGSIWNMLGEYEKSCEMLKKAIGMEPPDRSRRINTARICDQAGDFRSAEKLLEQGMRSPVDDLALTRELLDLYIRNGKLHYASTLLNMWQRDYPDTKEFSRWEYELLGR